MFLRLLIVGNKSEAGGNSTLKNRFETLWIFGDSLSVRFYRSLSKTFVCKRMFKRCHRTYNWIYPLESESEGKKRNDDNDFRPKIILNSIRDVLRRPDMKSNGSVLVLNLGLHYPASINFTTYQELIRDVITLLKARKQDLGNSAKVVWKTTTAMHKENCKQANKNSQNWRFFTPQVKKNDDTDRAVTLWIQCSLG